MSDLYDSETDGCAGDLNTNTQLEEPCDFCGGSGKVWYGIDGYDYEFPCPRCEKRNEENN